MIVRIKWAALQQTHGYEYLVRFALGGLATLLAGIVADRFGPETGGLFLAFPAIFCASATLIEKHERDRKARHGLKGGERGRRAAALDATGAGWGSLALGTFAIAIWSLAPYGALPALGLASMLWSLVAVGLLFLAENVAARLSRICAHHNLVNRTQLNVTQGLYGSCAAEEHELLQSR